MILSFHVPGSVQPKLRHRTAVFHQRDGSIGTMAYAETKTKNYESRVCLFATQAMAQQQVERFSGPVAVSCRFWLTVPKTYLSKRRQGSWHCQTPDVDNMKKSVMDGMNKVVFTDDCLVAVIYAEKRWTHGEPGVDVVVESLAEGDQFRLPLSWIVTVQNREGIRTSDDVLPFAPLDIGEKL